MAEENEGQGGERTEAATPQRLKQAREAGQVPLSREAVAFATLAAGTLAFAWTAPSGSRGLARGLAVFLGQGNGFTMPAGEALRRAGLLWLQVALPMAIAVAVAAAAASLMQTGFLIRGAALQPDLGRLNPMTGLRRLLGRDNLADALRSVAKLAAVGLVVWQLLRSDLAAIMTAPQTDLRAVPLQASRMLLNLLGAVLAVQAVIAVLDLVWARWSHARGLRMSRAEIRQEHKQTEGDPQVKRHIRRIQFQRARRRMMAAVPKATVVVTNPTHYAVALAYDRTKNAAPRVVAKGADHLAARIRALAAEHNVPVLANPPLARALFRVELDAEIPPEHYKAAAEIIAYVWRLRGRASAGTARQG